VEVVSRAPFEKLSVVLGLKDDREYHVFNVSTEALTGASISMGPDQALTCTFELVLHLVPGQYRFVTWVYRYDWESAATIFVSHDVDVHGVVNLYPTVQIGEKRLAPPPGKPAALLNPSLS
jgi:hypothetical protein